jgi:hypothetical protein
VVRNACGSPTHGPVTFAAVANIETNAQAGAEAGADGTAVTPEVLEALQTPSPGNEGSLDGEQVARPTKLIRIASMVRALLDEARLAPLDDAGRRSLKSKASSPMICARNSPT